MLCKRDAAEKEGKLLSVYTKQWAFREVPWAVSRNKTLASPGTHPKLPCSKKLIDFQLTWVYLKHICNTKKCHYSTSMQAPQEASSSKHQDNRLTMAKTCCCWLCRGSVNWGRAQSHYQTCTQSNEKSGFISQEGCSFSPRSYLFSELTLRKVWVPLLVSNASTTWGHFYVKSGLLC